MARFFRSDSISTDDIFTKRNAMVCGAIFAGCALAAYSFAAFFVAATVTFGFFLFNQHQQNENSFEARIERAFDM